MFSCLYRYTLALYVGTQSYKKELDYDVWIHCYLEYARKPPPLHPPEYEAAATAILERDFDITKDDITLQNAEAIYVYLIQVMS